MANILTVGQEVSRVCALGHPLRSYDFRSVWLRSDAAASYVGCRHLGPNRDVARAGAALAVGASVPAGGGVRDCRVADARRADGVRGRVRSVRLVLVLALDLLRRTTMNITIGFVTYRVETEDELRSFLVWWTASAVRRTA